MPRTIKQPKGKDNCGCNSYYLNTPVIMDYDQCKECGDDFEHHFMESPKLCSRCAMYSDQCRHCLKTLSKNN